MNIKWNTFHTLQGVDVCNSRDPRFKLAGVAKHDDMNNAAL